MMSDFGPGLILASKRCMALRNALTDYRHEMQARFWLSGGSDH